MGYRHYFYRCKKSDVAAIRDKSMEELEALAKELNTDLYFFNKKLFPRDEVFCFGKLYYEDTDERIYKTGIPLFSNPQVMEDFASDFQPYEVGKAGVLKAIEIYKEKIKAYYEQLTVDGATQILPFGIELPLPNITSEQKIKEHIKEKLHEIDRIVDTDSDRKDTLTRSYEYEYAIFNLVYILKTTDFDTETIIFLGW